MARAPRAALHIVASSCYSHIGFIFAYGTISVSGSLSSTYLLRIVEYPHISGSMSTLGELIKAKRDEKNWDQHKLAEFLDMSQPAISSLESGRSSVPRNWRGLAQFLEVSEPEFARMVIEAVFNTPGKYRLPADLRQLMRELDPRFRVRNLGDVVYRAQRDLHSSLPPIAAHHAPPMPTRDVPVYGRSQGGADGKFLFNGDVIGWEVRPPQLEGVRDAYATYVDGESMWPRYKPGETVWLNPHKPAARGDDVVVQLRPRDEHEPPFGFIKEYVRRTPTKLVVAQYNPAQEIEYDLDQVVSIHPVVFAQRG